ncbi:helix-turn-helix domain-containing protein [Parabacteroides sp. OttesenSCG-928-G07]|nr:helix-turn-helix domain-containing protein [Parabacteroides sp. OttesenSCG-928-G07]
MPRLNDYDSEMLYLPTVNDIYKDSVYLEPIGQYKRFDSNVYFDRFASLGAVEMSDETRYFYSEILSNMPKAQALNELDLMAQTAIRLKNKSFENEAEFVRMVFLLRSEEVSPEKLIQSAQILIDKAQKEKNTYLELKIKTFVLDKLWDSKKPDYSVFFRHALQLAEELDKQNNSEYTCTKRAYYLIGNAYYYFREYDKAKFFLEKAVSENTRFFYDNTNMLALGLLSILTYIQGDMNATDYYSMKMLESKDYVVRRPMYDAIAIINLGHTSLSRKEYDKAVVLLQEGLPVVKKYKDFQYIVDTYITLGNAYLEQKNTKQAKEVIDSARHYIETGDVGYRKHILYTLQSKYYAAIGQVDMSQKYIDSTLQANKQYEEEYNMLYILRAEQELSDSEKRIQEEKKNSYNRLLFIGIGVILFSVCILLLAIWIYRKRLRTFDLLKLKNAHFTETSGGDPVDNEEATVEDIMVMSSITDLMNTEQIFRNPALTADSLAEYMGITRQMIIKAINRTQKKNFAQYINELRIQEAILVLSNSDYDVQSYDQTAIDCGFFDRKSFFKAFKRETGLTPLEFRRNSVKKT